MPYKRKTKITKKSAKTDTTNCEGAFYIAVVTRGRVGPSERSRGDWASFISYDKTDVIESATHAATYWNSQPGSGFGSYRVFVGTITSEVVFPAPVTWKEKKL